MTKEKAAVLLAQYENTSGDAETERQNILRWQSFGGPLASPDVKDALAAEYRAELVNAIARGDSQ